MSTYRHIGDLLTGGDAATSLDACVANRTKTPLHPDVSSTGTGGNCENGCLFNVVEDPTEQSNLYSARPDIVANLTALLEAAAASFFDNSDRFTNACPEGRKNCACYIAKSKYGGFLGPYAMLDMDMEARSLS